MLTNRSSCLGQFLQTRLIHFDGALDDGAHVFELGRSAEGDAIGLADPGPANLVEELGTGELRGLGRTGQRKANDEEYCYPDHTMFSIAFSHCNFLPLKIQTTPIE